MRKRVVRPWVKKLHWYAAILCSIPLCIVALTGAILVFQEDLKPLLYPSIYKLEKPAHAVALSADTLVQRARRAAPADYRFFFIQQSHHAHYPFICTFRTAEKTRVSLALNPYTGEIVSHALERETMFTWITRLHRYLCMGEVGKQITGACCLILLASLLSGIVLWCPMKWRLLGKKNLCVLRKASSKRRVWEWHSLGGLYLFPCILLICLTGLLFSYKWTDDILRFVLHSPKEKTQLSNLPKSTQKSLAIPSHIDSLFYISRTLLPSQKSDLRLSLQRAPYRLTQYDYGHFIQRKNNVLYFDGGGVLLSQSRFENLSIAQQIQGLKYALHTGIFAGRISQVLFFIAALFVASLPVTGFLIYFRRQRKTKKGHRK